MSALPVPPVPAALPSDPTGFRTSSRYRLVGKIASGGMGTVYVARMGGASGFERIVAIKRAHPHLLEDPAFREMLLSEARIASLVHHPNVVAIQDVEEIGDELYLVMDYVEGVSLAELLVAEGGELAPRVGLRILLDACEGLHAVHELQDAAGAPLEIVHRDVSPQNLLVGLDGVTRVTDLGIAKARSIAGSRTMSGMLRGKPGYMPPEYVLRSEFDARSDLFAMAVVAWETLCGRRLFRGKNEVETLKMIVAGTVPAPSSKVPALAPFDALFAAALASEPKTRPATVALFAEQLEAIATKLGLVASRREVQERVQATAGRELASRRKLTAAAEHTFHTLAAVDLVDDDSPSARSGGARTGPPSFSAKEESGLVRTGPRDERPTYRPKRASEPDAAEVAPQNLVSFIMPGDDPVHVSFAPEAEPAPRRGRSGLVLGALCATLVLATAGLLGLRSGRPASPPAEAPADVLAAAPAQASEPPSVATPSRVAEVPAAPAASPAPPPSPPTPAGPSGPSGMPTRGHAAPPAPAVAAPTPVVTGAAVAASPSPPAAAAPAPAPQPVAAPQAAPTPSPAAQAKPEDVLRLPSKAPVDPYGAAPSREKSATRSMH